MKKICFVSLAFAGALFVSPLVRAQYASSVISYAPGTGFATEEFPATHIGYTNPAVALGQPNPNTDFGPVMPFNPPFSRNELVSIGTNGSLTVSFLTPISNDPGHPFGLDFIIYGSAGFVDVDYPNGMTDPFASMFGNNPGSTRVSVSADGSVFYPLNPLLAPVVDGLFPTDGSGTFGLPVNPALGAGDLANLTLAQIRALYAGSAGGTGYDLAWAVDINNLPVTLASISQIRVEVLDGRAEIDGFAAVPEPSAWALALTGAALLRLRRRLC